MRTFLVNADKNSKNYKKPLCNWGMLRPNTFYEGTVPEGYKLAINPSDNIIIVDVDVDEEKGKNGFDNIPHRLFLELEQTYNYDTKRTGRHYWLHYTGSKTLMNKASNQSIDLRVGYKEGHNGGYAIYYPANQGDDIRNHLNEIKETSIKMNEWLESLFC
jgi:hypothetical protein